MKTYILFIFGMFEDYEDIEYFCAQVLSENPNLKYLKFIVEREQNIIVFFNSDMDEKKLSDELFGFLVNDNIKFYFLFEQESLITANLPKEVKNFMLQTSAETTLVKVDYENINGSTKLDLDSVLDKIKELGISSLTPEEKKFLDNFEK
jgi:hypothetical protein